MAKRELLGTMACPECGFPDAQVKAQKNGLLYRWCTECEAQFFARKPEASERLQAKMRPVSVTGTDKQGGEAGKPARAAHDDAPPVPEPEKKPAARGGFNLGAL